MGRLAFISTWIYHGSTFYILPNHWGNVEAIVYVVVRKFGAIGINGSKPLSRCLLRQGYVPL